MAAETIRDVVLRLRIEQQKVVLAPPDTSAYKAAVDAAARYAKDAFSGIRPPGFASPGTPVSPPPIGARFAIDSPGNGAGGAVAGTAGLGAAGLAKSLEIPTRFLPPNTTEIEATRKRVSAPINISTRFDNPDVGAADAAIVRLTGSPFVIRTAIQAPDTTETIGAFEAVQAAAVEAAQAAGQLQEKLNSVSKISIADQAARAGLAPLTVDQVANQAANAGLKPVEPKPSTAPPVKSDDLDKTTKAAIRVGDALKNSGEGAFHLARGIALLSADSEKDLQEMIKNVAMVQAGFDLFKGSFEIVKGVTEAVGHLKEATGAASAVASIAAANDSISASVKTALNTALGFQTAASVKAAASQAVLTGAQTGAAATATAAGVAELGLATAEGAAAVAAGAAATANTGLAGANAGVAVTAKSASIAMVALQVATGPIGLVIAGIGAAVAAGTYIWRQYRNEAVETGKKVQEAVLATEAGIIRRNNAVKGQATEFKNKADVDREVGAFNAVNQQVNAARQLEAIDNRRARVAREMTDARRPDETQAQMVQRQLVAQQQLVELDRARVDVIDSQNLGLKDQLIALDARRNDALRERDAGGAGFRETNLPEHLDRQKAAEEELIRIEQERLKLMDDQAAALRQQHAHAQSIHDMAREALRTEQQRVASAEEQLGRLNPAERKEAERLAKKVEGGQQLTPAELKRAENLVPQSSQYVSDQFRQQGQQAFGGQGANRLASLTGGPLTGAGSREEQLTAEAQRAAAGEQAAAAAVRNLQPGNLAGTGREFIQFLTAEYEDRKKFEDQLLAYMRQRGNAQQQVTREEMARIAQQEIQRAAATAKQKKP